MDWTCPVCGLDSAGCNAVRRARTPTDGGRWAPGKVLTFMAGGSLEHYCHPDHYGVVGADEAEVMPRLVALFGYPGGVEALDARWAEWAEAGAVRA